MSREALLQSCVHVLLILVKCDEKCRELPIVISDNIAKINTTNMPMPINLAKKQQN